MIEIFLTSSDDVSAIKPKSGFVIPEDTLQVVIQPQALKIATGNFAIFYQLANQVYGTDFKTNLFPLMSKC